MHTACCAVQICSYQAALVQAAQLYTFMCVGITCMCPARWRLCAPLLLQVAHLYLTDAARLQQLMEWLLQPQRLKKWQQPLPAQAQQPASATRKGSTGRQARGSTKPGSAATKGSRKGGSDGGSSAAGHVDTGAGGRRVRGAGASKQSTAGA